MMPSHLPLSKRLYEETASIHEQVESSDFVVALRNQKLKQLQYVKYLADLKVVYDALEKGMRNNNENPVIKSIYDEKLNRTQSIEKDLESFASTDIKPSQAGIDYANHLHDLSSNTPLLLVAHAYVRYMGDLSGGRMLKKFVEQLFPGPHTAFYDLTALLGENTNGAKVVEYKTEWKNHLDSLELTENDKLAIINEAKKAFEFTGKIFTSAMT